jgi:ankyrin repeat protein
MWILKYQTNHTNFARFLLTQLHLDSLVGKRSPKAIRNTLKKLATGSDAYDHAYEDAMERVEGQVKDKEELAKQVLSWITCAKRPLRTSELQQALAVEVGDSELDKDNIPQIEDMVSVCAGLVTLDEESGIIRLVHYTIQEYFERTQLQWFPNADSDIAKICVTYLLFNVFGSGFCTPAEEFEERVLSYVLYEYAARHWGHHARKASTLIPEVMKFLDNEAHIEASTQAFNSIKAYTRMGSNICREFPIRMTGPHLAAYFGLEKAMKALLKKGAKVDSNDNIGRSPLSYAAGEGHEAVVRLLIETGIDIDFKDNDSLTPLLWAASNGHRDVVKLLLDAGAEPNSKDRFGRTSLWCAIRKGHKVLIDLLLESDNVDINWKDDHGTTLLLRAAESGHEDIVMLLLDKGADADMMDATGETLLSVAA